MKTLEAGRQKQSELKDGSGEVSGNRKERKESKKSKEPEENKKKKK